MASTLSPLSLRFFLFLLASPLSSATYHRNIPGSSSTASFPRRQGEKLIRQLNLFPKHATNRAVNDYDDMSLEISEYGNIVEKQFKFYLLSNQGPSFEDFGHYAGYYKLPHTKAARMFYFFFESRNSKSDPVVIWLTGGPGCSSELALFYENGPFQITKNLSLVSNDHGWDKASNIIYVDQPTGTGFSFSSDKNDTRHDETGISNDLYDFLQEFFKAHPQFAKNDFYITGESYAGHYIPAFATRVHQGNKKKQGIHINLKGFAIGNGLTNPAIQYKAYTDYALLNDIINISDYHKINKNIPECELGIKACGTTGESTCENALRICSYIFNEILSLTDNINYYDIRKKCKGELCYDFSSAETFLNKRAVRDALGVGEREYVSCSADVYEAMITDWMKNLEVGIPALLEDGVRVLIYAGELDLICNWLGNLRWVHAMRWSGQNEFFGASSVPFVVDSAEAGQLKSHGPLTFLKVHKAGHMVPMDQPKAALHMLKSWMEGTLG